MYVHLTLPHVSASHLSALSIQVVGIMRYKSGHHHHHHHRRRRRTLGMCKSPYFMCVDLYLFCAYTPLYVFATVPVLCVYN